MSVGDQLELSDVEPTTRRDGVLTRSELRGISSAFDDGVWCKLSLNEQITSMSTGELKTEHSFSSREEEEIEG